MNTSSLKRDYYIKDRDRSAFGLGWEYSRRGKAVDKNPFVKGHWKWYLFQLGHAQFKESKQ